MTIAAGPPITTDLLRDLLAAPGPVTSVYFDLEARPEEGEDAELRRQTLARQLAGQGTAPAAVRALTRRIQEALPGSGVLAAFAANDGTLLLDAVLPGSHQDDLALHGPLPRLLPLLEWHQEHPAHVLAVVDRTGADLESYPNGATRPLRRTVNGSDDEIERNQPGGWSQMRYQHRAEDSWEHNAARVADALGSTLSRVSARLLLVAGDVRALQYLSKHLPVWVRQQVSIRRVSGSRSRDGSREERASQIAAETHRAAHEETKAVLRRLAEERHPAGRTVEGAYATLSALARGKVATLVITHDPSDRRRAWFGPLPTDISDRRQALLRRGVNPLTRAPLVDVAVRSALLTGAEVRVLPPGIEGTPTHGIGALCRYA